jgi:hypothetical protein
MKEFLRERRPVAKHQQIPILLAAKIEIPRLICHKSLGSEVDHQMASPVTLISLAVLKHPDA